MYKIGKFSISILAVFAILFSFYSSSVEAETRFPDVKTSRDEILYLADKGIIKGYESGKFGPNDPIKRVHAVQMILRELGVKTGDAPNPNYPDVKPEDYGYADIAKATQLGIVSGKTSGKFDPNGTLTRGEMAKILVEAYKLTSDEGVNFHDVPYSHFSHTYVGVLYTHNISTGYPDRTYRPDAKMTREHFALFMARLLNDQFRMYQTSPYDLGSDDFWIAWNKINQSIVHIKLYDENENVVKEGGGFITSNNLIATTFENISGGVKAEAYVYSSGEKYLLEGVVDYNEYYDIALLKPVNKIGLPSLPLAKFSTIGLEDNVLAYGFYEDNVRSYNRGQVIDLLEIESDIGDFKLIENSSEYIYGKGFFGAPLLNDRGYVIGINSFSIYDYEIDGFIYYAISSDYLDEILKPYREKKFSEIAVESFSDMPEFDYEDEDEDE